MSMDIKFRAWDKKENMMITWDTLSQHACNRGETNLIYDILVLYKHNYIVMLYSGYNDENNNEVYAGDIISNNQWNPRDYMVIFEDGEFSFVTFNRLENPYTNSIHYVENFTRIGNIYQNPELIK
jgi:hypothetical protein